MNLDENRYASIPEKSVLDAVADSMRERGFDVIRAENKHDALEKLKEIVPEGSSVITGSSTTLREIGFNELLDAGAWKDMHKAIFEEPDQAKRMQMRKEANIGADFFIASVNAVSKDGALVSCDASGSRVSAYPYDAKRLVFIIGAQKIAGSIEDAMKRVREYAFPLEDQRARAAYGVGSSLSKWVILEKEPIPHRITIILVNEKLGF